MPNVDSHAPGTFCWFELATSDREAAKTFYTQLFDWTVDDQPSGPGQIYSTFSVGGRDAAAAYTLNDEQRSHGVPPFWGLYVLVENADAIADHTAAMGGQVVVPAFDVMDIGRMAVLQDPTGAVFSVWQVKTHCGTGIVGEPGTMVWGELHSPDRDRAASFYANLFGWKMVAGKDMREPTAEDYFHIMNGDDMIGGMPSAAHRDPNAPPSWLLYFGTTDCAASATKATSLGATVVAGPMDIGDDGTIAVMSDPQGAMFALHQKK
jgi:predicted enzyme related to lactoylglutathione lyase